MTKKYIWGDGEYNSLAEANAAAQQRKDTLDTQPSQYCTVKLLGGNETDGWVVPVEDMTDAEVVALQDNDGNHYAIYSMFEGETQMGLTSNVIKTEVQRLKRGFGSIMAATKIYIEEEVDTDVDMSEYVTSE